MTSTLAEALPRSRFREQHTLVVDAPAEKVWVALSTVQWSDLRLTAPLMLVRGLGRTRGAFGRRLLDQGPVRLLHADPPRYAAAAAIGRPWQLRPERGPEAGSLADILAFDEPGWLKYGMDFTMTAARTERARGATATQITTTTLCEPTDEAARRRFAPYWRAIRPFSGLIRRDMLSAIARETRGRH